VKANWLLPSVFSCVMVTLPATAAEVVSWRFDPAENRIDFTTTGEIRPSAQMLANPSRLAIDLPNTTLNQPTQGQQLSGGIRSLRVGQFDQATTRMVLEFDPGFAVDPQQVLIKASTSKQWSVYIPTPQTLNSFPGGAPVGQVAVFTQNGQLVPSNQTPPRIASNASTAIVNYIAIDPTRTGILFQANREFNSLLRYTTGWDLQSGSYKITIPNARLAPNYQIPVASQRYLRVGMEGDNLYVLVRRGDGVRVDIVRQYLDNRWVYMQAISGNTRMANRPVAVPIPVPRPETRRPEPEPKQNPTPSRVPSNGRVLVMLDPGHGGKDPGAIGPDGTKEVDVIMPIARRVAAILDRQGIAVKMTRTGDYFVGLDDRVDISRSAGATIFVSIHANSIDGRPDVNGLETYHYNIGQSLAESVHSNVVSHVNSKGFYLNDRRVRSARFLVLRKSSIPAILVETGYLTSEAEVARLRNPEYQRVMAEGIAKGIVQYIRERN
jgi:N-acetylmuramoyl-L-alanine amidase